MAGVARADRRAPARRGNDNAHDALLARARPCHEARGLRPTTLDVGFYRM